MISLFFKSSYKALQRFYHEDYFYRASALTYTTLLAIVPLLSVIVFFMTRFPFFHDLMVSAQSYILKNFIPASASSLERYFQGFVARASQLPSASIIFLLVTAILLINTIEDTLDEVWKVAVKRRKIRSLLMCWIILVSAPMVLGLSVFLTSYFLKWVSGVTEFLGITRTLIFISSIAINSFLFTLLYITVPNSKVRWRDGVTAGIYAGILFEFARNIFAYYVTNFPSYEMIYGAFAVIPIFLVWLYIAWCIILFGALYARSRAVLSARNVSVS